MDGHDHVPRQPARSGPLQGDRAAAGAGRGRDRGRSADVGGGGQGRRLDRRRASRQRGAGGAAADGAGVADGEPRRRRDAPLPRRSGPAGGPREPGRPRLVRRLVHAARRPDGAHHPGRAGPVPEVRGTRQQPRLLHVGADRDREHEPGDLPGVVSADRVQPSPDGTAGHGHVRAAVPRSAEPQLGPADPHQPGPSGLGDAPPDGRRGEGGHHDAPGRELLDVVERRTPHDPVLPQHDRAAHRDDRPPDADRDSVPAQPPDHLRRPAAAGPAGAVALPPVGGLLPDRQPCRARLRRPQPGAPPLQHLAHGDELDRAGQPRLVDHPAQVDRRGDGGAGPPGLAGRLRLLPAGPGEAGRAGLRPAFRPAGLSHRDQVRQRAAQERRDGSLGHGGVRGRRQELPGGLLRREDGAGVPSAGDRHVRAAEPPQRLPVPRGTADRALRQRRVDAGSPDGRGVRPHPGQLRRPLRADCLDGRDHGRRRDRPRVARWLAGRSREQRLRGRQPRAGGGRARAVAGGAPGCAGRFGLRGRVVPRGGVLLPSRRRGPGDGGGVGGGGRRRVPRGGGGADGGCAGAVERAGRPVGPLRRLDAVGVDPSGAGELRVRLRGGLPARD